METDNVGAPSVPGMVITTGIKTLSAVDTHACTHTHTHTHTHTLTERTHAALEKEQLSKCRSRLP